MFGFGSKKWPGLAKLNEECGELIQVIGKLMMVKGRSKHWSGDLRKKMIEELGDVMAASEFVSRHCLTDNERFDLHERITEKRAKFLGWHEERRK